jgi:hypothetical protein
MAMTIKPAVMQFDQAKYEYCLKEKINKQQHHTKQQQQQQQQQKQQPYY